MRSPLLQQIIFNFSCRQPTTTHIHLHTKLCLGLGRDGQVGKHRSGPSPLLARNTTLYPNTQTCLRLTRRNVSIGVASVLEDRPSSLVGTFLLGSSLKLGRILRASWLPLVPPQHCGWRTPTKIGGCPSASLSTNLGKGTFSTSMWLGLLPWMLQQPCGLPEEQGDPCGTMFNTPKCWGSFQLPLDSHQPEGEEGSHLLAG